MSELKRLTTDEVKERLEEIYGDMYDLNKLTYVNSNTPIQLTNNTTGERISLSLVQLLRVKEEVMKISKNLSESYV